MVADLVRQTIARGVLLSAAVLADALFAFPEPAWVTVDGRAAGARVEITTDGCVLLKGGEASTVKIRWRRTTSPDARVFGDEWGCSNGDHFWARLGDPDACKSQRGAMAWYFLLNEGGRTDGYGVKVQPNAFASWRADLEGFTLSLDVRAGSDSVQLGTRTLEACTLVSAHGATNETPFCVGRRLCRLMCPEAHLPSTPIYGFNDWYNTYGRNSATNLIADARFWFDAMDRVASQSGRRVTNRPFVVADDGWQKDTDWAEVHSRWGLAMDEFARRVKAMNAKPGLWYRPLKRPGGRPTDPTVAGTEEKIRREIARFRDWGFDLVKIDFLLYDWNGTAPDACFDTPIVRDDLHWSRRDRTGAEVVLSLYRAMREAAGDRMLIIGCGALDHFSAGLFEANRTGGDTCGYYWPVVGCRGPCAIGMRAIQHGVFYAVDGDVVAWNDRSEISIHRPIPWRQNRQWFDLIVRSGTLAFVSWNRGDARAGDVGFLAESLMRASEPQKTCEPLDWLTQSSPRRWRFGSETAEYDWEVQTANAVPFVPESGALVQTSALQATIDRLAASGGGRIVVPKGVWTIGPVFFRPGTSLRLEADASLRDVGGHDGSVALVNADGVDAFTVDGPGAIEGLGTGPILSVSRARAVTVRHVTFRSQAGRACRFAGCSDVLVERCTVETDGPEVRGAAEAFDFEAVDGAVVTECRSAIRHGGKPLSFLSLPETSVPRDSTQP